MPAALIPSFLFYCYVTAITPGPANLSSLAASLNYGKKQALKQWRGLAVGFVIDSMIAVFLCYFLGEAIGDKVQFLSYIGAAYIIWLAVHIFRSKGDSEEEAEKNCNFTTGLLINLTNVKVILFCITALSVYVLPHSDSFLVLFLTGCFLPFTGPICNLAWLYAGIPLRGIFQKHRRLLNGIMSLSLIACAVSIIVV